LDHLCRTDTQWKHRLLGSFRMKVCLFSIALYQEANRFN
jgi:hypothetical protein